MDIVGIILVGMAFLTMLTGGVLMLIATFRVNILWGLGSLFFPIVGLLFLCMHWDKARLPFLINLSGIALLVLGCILSPAIMNHRSSDRLSRHPGYFASESLSQKNQQIVSNMESVQRVVTQYAGTHGGRFPVKVDELKEFFPGGQKGLPNPCNGKLEYPVPGGSTDLEATRSSAATKNMIPGSIEYNLLPDLATYVIVGGGEDGKGLRVLSNK